MRAERWSRRAALRFLSRGLRVAGLATLVAAASLGVAGCASVSSTVDDPKAEVLHEGLVYWLPKRDIKVTVDFDQSGMG